MFLSVFFFRNSLQFKKVSLPLQPQTRNNGAIAQLVEQRTENPCVPGSIPGGTTLQGTKAAWTLRSGGSFYFQPIRQGAASAEGASFSRSDFW